MHSVVIPKVAFGERARPACRVRHLAERFPTERLPQDASNWRQDAGAPLLRKTFGEVPWRFADNMPDNWNIGRRPVRRADILSAFLLMSSSGVRSSVSAARPKGENRVTSLINHPNLGSPRSHALYQPKAIAVK